MENAGLITYREVALLLDPATAPLAVQKRVAEVVTHELAHQWFGNWVTMVWWDDLWLNEAFATWMAYKIVDAWKPDWRVWLDFDAGKATALHLDALRSTHPIRGTVLNAAEATESFDAITYEKGGAVLRMLEGFLGEEAFRSRHPRLHAAARPGQRGGRRPLGRAGAGLAGPGGGGGQRLDPPERLPGHLRVELEGDRVRLAQERFFSEPGLTGTERWPVPLVLAWADDGGRHSRAVLLRGGLDRGGPRRAGSGRSGSTPTPGRPASTGWPTPAEALERLGRASVGRCSPPSGSVSSPTSGRWCAPVGRRSATSSTWSSASRARPTTRCSTSWWGSWATSSRGWSTARTRSGSAGWWSGSSGRGCGRWAGIRWPGRATTTGSGGERCCGRWPAWPARPRCWPRPRRGWTGC